MRIDLIILLLLCISNIKLVSAQDSLQHHRSNYYNTFSAGAMFGNKSNPITASLTTTHGIILRQWRIGIGIGLDGYERWRVIPFFGSVSVDFSRTKNSLFLQVNTGHSVGKKISNETIHNVKDYGGWIFNPMIGYRMMQGKRSVIVSAGYKHQRVHYSYSLVRGFVMGNNPYTMNEKLDRFFVKIGVGLN